MTRLYPTADALTAAAANLEPADARKLSAVPLETGGFEVSGPPDILAALETGPSKVRLKAYAAERRWRLETAGYLWSGRVVATDRDSRAIIGQERQAISLGERQDPDGFKIAGELVMISNADFVAMATAVREFVRACFAAEGLIAAAIDAGTITSFEAIDAAAWPSAA